MTKFTDDIKAFNAMYKLPAPAKPTLEAVGDVVGRLHSFKKTLLEEVDEVHSIVEACIDRHSTPESALAMIAAWLGNLQIYCASEMLKFGLPNEIVRAIIMQSHFSKLGADGKPLYDEHGKVLKGPNYWKPEPQLEGLIHDLLNPPKPYEWEPADFSTWERKNLEKFARDSHAQNCALHEELRTAMHGWRKQVVDGAYRTAIGELTTIPPQL